MKTILLLIFILLGGCVGTQQISSTETEEKVFIPYPENSKIPEPIGGIEGIVAKVKYPAAAKMKKLKAGS